MNASLPSLCPVLGKVRPLVILSTWRVQEETLASEGKPDFPVRIYLFLCTECDDNITKYHYCITSVDTYYVIRCDI